MQINQLLPKLDGTEFAISPTEAQLAMLARSHGSSELKHIANFSVTHKTWGSVRWLEPVDVCRLPLKDVIKISQSNVDVSNQEPRGRMVPFTIMSSFCIPKLMLRILLCLSLGMQHHAMSLSPAFQKTCGGSRLLSVDAGCLLYQVLTLSYGLQLCLSTCSRLLHLMSAKPRLLTCNQR